MDLCDSFLNELMPPEYTENGEKINSNNKICVATQNYFHEYIWPYISENNPLQGEYPAYTAWLRCAYGVDGIEKFWVQSSEYIGVFYNEIINFSDTISKALKQIVCGNYSDDITVTGTTGQIIVGFSGIDFVADIRDVTYDIDHWEWSWSHAGQTGLDMIGILPIVGSLKYSDEMATLKKISQLEAADALEDSVDSINSALKAGKKYDEITDIEKLALLNKLNKLVETDIIEIAKKYENFQCEQCAKAIQNELTNLNLHGTRIELQCKLTQGGNWNGNIYCNSLDQVVSTNGHHSAVLFNNKVFDNLHPNGVSYETWLKDFDFGFPNVYADFSGNIDF